MCVDHKRRNEDKLIVYAHYLIILNRIEFTFFYKKYSLGKICNALLWQKKT